MPPPPRVAVAKAATSIAIAHRHPKISRAVAFAKKHWFTLSVPPLAGFCFEYPDYFRRGGTLHVQQWKEYALMGIFLSTGMGMKVAAMAPLAKQVKTHALIQGSIFVGAPLLFATVAHGFLEPLGVPKPLIFGFLFTSCLPTTVGTCLAFTSAARGNMGASMFNVALSNMSGILLTPALCLALTGMESSVDQLPLLGKLGTQVVLPTAVGLAMGWRYPSKVNSVSSVVSKLPQVFVLPLLANAFSDSFVVEAHKECDAKSMAILLAATIGVNWAMMRGTYAVARQAKLPEATRRSVVFTGSQKTAALGVPLLGLMFQDNKTLGLMTLPLVCYHAVQCAATSIFVAMMLV